VVIGSTLTLTVKNLDESQVSTIKWKSNRTSIAKVDQKGVVTPVKVGTTTIKCTITYKDKTKQTLSCTVTVKKRVKATAITINNAEKAASLKVGEHVTLKATLSPANTTDQIYWFSSNKAVATVGLTSGKVTAKKEGTVVITAKAGLDKKGAAAKTNKVVTEIKIEVTAKNGSKKATDENLFEWREDENGIAITGYKEGLPEDVVIPEEINGIAVTSIAYPAFFGCTDLKSISIPEGVKSIEYETFFSCSNLSSVTIPKGVMSIGYKTFIYCSSLRSVTIQKGVTSIGSGAFRDCSSLESVTIPEGVTSIGDNAFSGCQSLTNVTIPESVTSIGDNMFYDCSGLKKIQVAKGNKIYDSRENSNAIIETKSNNLIIGCKNTIIPDSVTGIGNRAFYSCRGLTNITIPDSVTGIGDSAFSHCSDLTSLTIPDSVTSIGDSAFSYCSGLISITIPNNVTSIGDSAFSYCSGLTSITIPNSVTSIGTAAFYSCSGLTSITIPNSVTNIGAVAFYRCSGMANITIPDSVTSIGSRAFAYCSELTSIIIPDSVTSIDDAFSGCSELKIHGKKDSYAQEYAEKNNIPFVEE